MRKHRRHRKIRPIGPNGIDQVVFCLNTDAFGFQFFFNIGHSLDHHGGPIEAQPSAFRQLLGQPLIPGQDIGTPQINNLNIGAGQLLFRLKPISTIGPHIRSVF